MVEPTPLRRPLSPVDAYVATVLADAPPPTAEQKALISTVIGPLLVEQAREKSKPARRSRRTARRAA